MPQVSAYLSDESGLPASDDTPKLDNSKVETWSLFLPSAILKDDRSPCHKGVVETERVLRLAQLQDSLADLRQFRRALRNLRLYFKTNTAGEGQKTQTKSRTIESGVNSRIKRAVWRYRIAYRGLLELDPAGDWAKDYHELKDEDNRGPLKEIEERGPGDGRYTPSWIWTSPLAMVLPGEGSVTEQREVNKTARHEWMTCRARADRWIEEEELLREEMRRVIVYLEWKSRTWSEKVGVRVGSCTPDIQRGVDAYARKQSNIHREIAMLFASQWLPYLDARGLDTTWATEFSWFSLARKATLPKKFSVSPTSAPHPVPAKDSPPGAEGLGTGQERPDASTSAPHPVPATDLPPSTEGLGIGQKHPDASTSTPCPLPATDLPPGTEGLGIGQGHPDTCDTRSEDKGEAERSKRANEGYGIGEQDTDDEGEDYGDGDRDYSDGDRDYGDEDMDCSDEDVDCSNEDDDQEGGGYDDGAGASNGLGFDFDDDYMS